MIRAIGVAIASKTVREVGRPCPPECEVRHRSGVAGPGRGLACWVVPACPGRATGSAAGGARHRYEGRGPRRARGPQRGLATAGRGRGARGGDLQLLVGPTAPPCHPPGPPGPPGAEAVRA